MKLKYKHSVVTAFALAFVVCATNVKAQLNPLASQYYSNQYLFNPAMAGLNSGLNINLDYRKQAIGVDGSPSTQSGTVEYQMNKVGLGLNLYNDFSGLIRTTRAVVTYAYHLPIGANNQKLNFGLSAGLLNQHLQTNNIVGDASDQTVANFNNKQNYLDGDFGISYTSNSLTIQGVLPNLHSVFKDNNTVDKSLYFASASYKLGDPKDITFEPKAIFRGIKGAPGILDAGLNVGFNNNIFNIQGLYHSNNTATFGFGLNKASFAILAFYTTNTATINYNASGDVELGLKLNL
ncbi:PorP/SprF family type IX secretion system membrane protein [Mucilaginibacter sp. AW1-3]